jgi:hypothetical protein
MIVDSVRWAAENGGPGEAAERHAHGRSAPGPDEAAPAPSGTQPAPVVTP